MFPENAVHTGPPIPVTEEAYMEACDQYMGWCTECKDFTRECCEPDARYYDCPECEKHSVHGAEEALLCGLITMVEEEEGEV
jgi:hypothetical protein